MSTNPATPSGRTGAKSVRLHYLDWLRVLAILGVFFFHTVRPFDQLSWAINNPEQSSLATLFIIFFAPWGMPLFFFLSGAGTWFALRRRTGRQYAVERVQRLLVPFIVGCILLTPFQLYFNWLHHTRTGLFEGSLWEFFLSRAIVTGPRIFGWLGYHLWFLGFLFAFSLLALPLFLWLKRDAGQRTIGWLARLSEWRGGILLFVLPLIVIQLILHPLFPAYQDWTDFVYMLALFVYGYILYADERFVRVVERDWPLLLAGAVLTSILILALGVTGVLTSWMNSPGQPAYYAFWTVYGINTWCWILFVLYIGTRFLDFTNKWLVYGQETVLPFYLLHHPVIITIAYFVVQWDLGITLKLLIVVLGSFLITLGLVEIIKRVKVLRTLFGVKTLRSEAPSKGAG